MKLAVIFYNTRNLGNKTPKITKENGTAVLPNGHNLQDSFKKAMPEAQNKFFVKMKALLGEIFHKKSLSNATISGEEVKLSKPSTTKLMENSTASYAKDIILTNTKDGTRIKANILKNSNREGIETFSLYDESGEMLGFTKIADNSNYSTPEGKGIVYVELMESTKPNYGIGTKLHQIAIERSKQLGYEGRVFLDAGFSSHAFHYKSGFRPQYSTSGELTIDEITKEIKEAINSDKEKPSTEFLGNIIMTLPKDSLEKWNSIIEKNPILK